MIGWAAVNSNMGLCHTTFLTVSIPCSTVGPRRLHSTSINLSRTCRALEASLSSAQLHHPTALAACQRGAATGETELYGAELLTNAFEDVSRTPSAHLQQMHFVKRSACPQGARTSGRSLGRFQWEGSAMRKIAASFWPCQLAYGPRTFRTEHD